MGGSKNSGLYRPSDPEVASGEDGTLTVADVAEIVADDDITGVVDAAAEDGLTVEDEAASDAQYVASLSGSSEHEAVDGLRQAVAADSFESEDDPMNEDEALIEGLLT